MQGTTIQPRITEREEELTIGMGGGFGEGNFEEIKDLWQKFLKHEMNIPDRRFGYALGICAPTHPDISKKQGESFVYVAAVPVEKIGTVPPGMVTWKIPRSKYAVFTHRGALRDLPQTVKYIWQEWLPNCEYQHAEGQPDFELYDERFHPETESGEIDIYVPIK